MPDIRAIAGLSGTGLVPAKVGTGGVLLPFDGLLEVKWTDSWGSGASGNSDSPVVPVNEVWYITAASCRLSGSAVTSLSRIRMACMLNGVNACGVLEDLGTSWDGQRWYPWANGAVLVMGPGSFMRSRWEASSSTSPTMTSQMCGYYINVPTNIPIKRLTP